MHTHIHSLSHSHTHTRTRSHTYPRDADGTFQMTGVAELDNVCEALGLELDEEAMEVRTLHHAVCPVRTGVVIWMTSQCLVLLILCLD